jgi:hypothetical protein
MTERLGLYLTKPPFSEFEEGNEVLNNTTVITPHLPEDFNYDDYKMVITPIGSVVVIPVFPLDGSDMEEDLGGAFIGGYLGLYTPQRTEGDQILIEIEDGLKTATSRSWKILARFEKGKWEQCDLRSPLTIQSDK